MLGDGWSYLMVSRHSMRRSSKWATKTTRLRVRVRVPLDKTWPQWGTVLGKCELRHAQWPLQIPKLEVHTIYAIICYSTSILGSRNSHWMMSCCYVHIGNVTCWLILIWPSADLDERESWKPDVSHHRDGCRGTPETPYLTHIGSMYAIYGNIYHPYTPNVSIYTSTIYPSWVNEYKWFIARVSILMAPDPWSLMAMNPSFQCLNPASLPTWTSLFFFLVEAYVCLWNSNSNFFLVET